LAELALLEERWEGGSGGSVAGTLKKRMRLQLWKVFLVMETSAEIDKRYLLPKKSENCIVILIVLGPTVFR
jgi:hypothetical protein